MTAVEILVVVEVLAILVPSTTQKGDENHEYNQ